MEISKTYVRTVPTEKYTVFKIGLTLTKKIEGKVDPKRIAKISRILYKLCKQIVEREIKEELNENSSS